jgi:hypothetical protein
MDERRLTKEIYEAVVGDNAGRDQIEEVLEKGQVKSTYPKPASVSEEFDDSRRSERCGRIVARERK